MMVEFGCKKGKQKMSKQLDRAGFKPTDIKEEDRDYYLERRYPAFGNLTPRDVKL